MAKIESTSSKYTQQQQQQQHILYTVVTKLFDFKWTNVCDKWQHLLVYTLHGDKSIWLKVAKENEMYTYTCMCWGMYLLLLLPYELPSDSTNRRGEIPADEGHKNCESISLRLNEWAKIAGCLHNHNRTRNPYKSLVYVSVSVSVSVFFDAFLRALHFFVPRVCESLMLALQVGKNKTNSVMAHTRARTHSASVLRCY